MNGDHKADVILGTADTGRARIVFGSATLGSPSGVVNVESMPAQVGFTISGTGGTGAPAVAAGDVNGDGKAELLIASHRQLSAYDNRSRVSVVLGRTSFSSFSLGSPPAGQVFELLMAKSDGEVAYMRSADWNGDGKADVLIGAPFADIENRGSTVRCPRPSHSDKYAA